MDKEHRRMRKEWRKINDVKEVKSKRNIFLIIFWSALLVYSIARLIMSVILQFEDKASVDVTSQGQVLVSDYEYYASDDSWASSNANKFIKIAIYGIFAMYSIWIYRNFIIGRLDPSQTKMYLILLLGSAIYAATNLPTYKDTETKDKYIFHSWQGFRDSSFPSNIIKIVNDDPSQLHNYFGFSYNFMGQVTKNLFLIELLIMVIPLGVAGISYSIMQFIPDQDRVVW